jgi:hypothetical protein
VSEGKNRLVKFETRWTRPFQLFWTFAALKEFSLQHELITPGEILGHAKIEGSMRSRHRSTAFGNSTTSIWTISCIATPWSRLTRRAADRFARSKGNSTSLLDIPRIVWSNSPQLRL